MVDEIWTNKTKNNKRFYQYALATCISIWNVLHIVVILLIISDIIYNTLSFEDVDDDILFDVNY